MGMNRSFSTPLYFSLFAWNIPEYNFQAMKKTESILVQPHLLDAPQFGKILQ